MAPRAKKLDALRCDFLSLQENLEELLAKEVLQRREVQVFGCRVKDAVSGEDSQGAQAMGVRVEVQKSAVGLGGDEHRGQRLLETGKLRLEELLGRGVGRAAEVAVKTPIPEKKRTEHLRDGKHQLHPGNIWEHLRDHPLGPQKSTFLSATRTGSSRFSGERDEPLLLRCAIRIRATQPEEAEVWVATASESFKKIFHPWVERSVVGTKTLVVHVKQLLEMVLDNLLERVGRTAGAVARGGKCRQGEM